MLEHTGEAELPKVMDGESESPKVTDDESKTTVESADPAKVTDAESTIPEFETTPRKLETDSTSIKSSTEVKTDAPSSAESSGRARIGTGKTIHSSTPSSSSTSSTSKSTQKAEEEEGLWSKLKKGAASVYETAKGGLANLSDRFSKWLRKRSHDSKVAAAESTTPVVNLRRRKSVDGDDASDEDHKITLDWKRIEGDDGKQQSNVRPEKKAGMTAVPASPKFQTKGAASPNVPVRPTLRQVPFDRPSGKLHGTDSPSGNLPEEGAPSPTNEEGDFGKEDMASEETRPKPKYYRRRDPLTKKEYMVDVPIARDESGRPYRNRKLPRRKYHRKEYPSTEIGGDELGGGALWDRDDFLIR
ncbi:hypothetical protein Aduo_006716 [Ancylostoma duodenale]